jgi:hypothetical protein
MGRGTDSVRSHCDGMRSCRNSRTGINHSAAHATVVLSYRNRRKN